MFVSVEFPIGIGVELLDDHSAVLDQVIRRNLAFGFGQTVEKRIKGEPGGIRRQGNSPTNGSHRHCLTAEARESM